MHSSKINKPPDQHSFPTVVHNLCLYWADSLALQFSEVYKKREKKKT